MKSVTYHAPQTVSENAYIIFGLSNHIASIFGELYSTNNSVLS